jgi:hypothetical protein
MKKNRVTLYCFSPPVMIITFLLEILFAIYVLIKSIKYKVDFGFVLILLFLAMFQLSEYQICMGHDLLFWARIGLFSITFLPALGYYLIVKLKKESSLVKLAFFLAISFATLLVLNPTSINTVSCEGNYVIFDVDSRIHSLYGYYYFGFLFLGIHEAAKGINNKDLSSRIKKALKWFIVGYLSFILPLTVVYIFMPITRVAVASIMCGFAIVFAAILTFKIFPLFYGDKKTTDKKNIDN